MCRTAMSRGSTAAHNLAACSQSELGFATHFNYVSRSATALAKRLSGPHARPGELRDGAIESPDQCGDDCVLFWNRKSHISNGTAKSVGSHSVSNSESGGVSVDDCATTKILVWGFDAVSGPGMVPGPGTASNPQTSISVMTTEPIKIPLKVAFSALF